MPFKLKLITKSSLKISVFALSAALASVSFTQGATAQGPDAELIIQQIQEAAGAPQVQPPPGQLASPQSQPYQGGQDEVLNGVPGGPTPALVPGQDVAEEDLFFDSQSLAPQSEQSQKGAPSKVNPRTSPASTFIIVRKGADAGSADANVVAAKRALKLGRYDSALDLFDEVYADNKRDPNVLLGRAVTLQKLGRIDEAISSYEELLDIAPDNVEAHLNMLGLVAQRYPSVAVRRLEALREKHPKDAGIVSQIAIAYGQVGRYEDAMKYLGIASSMNPRDPGPLYNMAIIADRAGDHAQAIELYEQALEADTIHAGGRSLPRESVYERLAVLR